MKFWAGFAVVVLTIGAYWYLHRPLHYPAGVLVDEDPSQMLLPDATAPIHYGSFALKPLALYSIDARILHRRNYRFDPGAALVPVDLAVGWGPMSDQSVLDQLSINQSMRFYWFEYRLPPPIPLPEIISQSANMHIIPATPEIASRCKSLRAGTLEHLVGDLVEASGPGIPHWRSSLTRTDTGNGACELFYVEEIQEISAEQMSKNHVLASK